MKKIIAIDLDGTLLNSYGQITENTKDALLKAQEKGVFVVGSCTSPKTLPDTLSEARSAAMEVFNYLTNGWKLRVKI